MSVGARRCAVLLCCSVSQARRVSAFLAASWVAASARARHQPELEQVPTVQRNPALKRTLKLCKGVSTKTDNTHAHSILLS